MKEVHWAFNKEGRGRGVAGVLGGSLKRQLTYYIRVSKTYIDPNFKEPIANVTAPVGREAILSCVVQDLAEYKVAWLRVDTQTILTIASHVITKNHRIAVSHSDHRTWFLHIREVKESDRGWYMCQINTDPMKSQTGYLEVVVNYVEGPNFNISKVDRSHMGFYLCIASNGVPPSVSKRIMLTVQFPPMIWVQNQLVGAQEGQQLTLECLSEAYPKSINYWTRDKDEIVPQGGKYEPTLVDNAYKVHMKLTINSVGPSDFGSYKCVSRNALGDTDGTIKVYPIASSNSTGSTTRYKGKLRHNSGNDIFEGNQDMLKERDLKLRGRKETSGNEEDDYEDSGAASSKNSFSLIFVLVTFSIYLRHHPQLRTLHPA
ncbi:neurotrimin-like isoform X2 [Apis florea]|uniref:neurotrimin-like isoform X2 n=1 Tax=Apis florea TaxID=7463 RepID=UPI0012FEBDF4|nr:neurotrimin-like isoform X2 [Apis florea]